MPEWSFYNTARANEVIAPDAFDGAIGKTIPLVYDGEKVGEATVVSAEVDADGRGVRVTLSGGWAALPEDRDPAKLSAQVPFDG